MPRLVQSVFCWVCGEAFPLPYKQSPDRVRYCPGCRPAVRRATTDRHHAMRESNSIDLDRAHRWTRQVQERTAAKATQRHAPWTERDDLVVIALASMPIEETCDLLGRSLLSVQQRRWKLRRRGKL